jgi:hypothetical protein
MKPILLILCFSVCAFGQNDVCKETSNIETLSIAAGDSIQTINRRIKDSDESRTLRLEVQGGTHEGTEGILIKRSNVCLFGIDRPVIKRTKFNNEAAEPSIIKIWSASNVSVTGFEIQGTIDQENRDVGPAGISVVNFDNIKGVSNIYIENNLIHSIGQLYDYQNTNGLWRYKVDNKSACKKTKTLGGTRIKINCGQAHGIYVASNENPISTIFIRGNTLRNLRLGESEAITIGERISGFDISRNTIYDVDNIAIDIAGRQSSINQSTNGTVSSNIIYDLKGACENGKCEGGQNDAYPFVAGIYIDGGTGLSWEESIKVTENTVTNFGIGISVGSENKFCNKNPQQCNDDYCLRNSTKCKKNKCLLKKKCDYVQVQFVELKSNVLKNNQVYGIGIGKDPKEQNSQTWNVRIVGNTIIDNVLSQDEDKKGYSQLHFGSLEAASLGSIDVRNNVIKAFGNNASLLVRVKGSDSLLFLIPDVKFYENIFYSDNPLIWQWGVSKDKAKDYEKKELVHEGSILNLPKGIVGANNIWTDKHN